jgi:hypothetical protein
MSSTTCDQVAERIALGEPLADLGEHAATCERCKRLVALPVELGAIHRDADPGLGFSARMTAGAQHRIVVRRRRRIAAGLAAAVAAGTLGVYAFTRQPESSQSMATKTNPPTRDQATATNNQDKDPWANDASEDADVDDDMRALVLNTDAVSRYHADWKGITKPLAPYRALIRGVGHE